MSAPQARFLISAVGPKQYPPADRPEVAFAGRSNVGKSSLLNRLLNRRKLARTSSTPGRTQTINFFEVGDLMYFVDLPGFGYAKAPLSVRAAWQPMVEGYLTAPRDLRLVLVLHDLRREAGREEKELLAWLQREGLAALVVATKTDKVRRSRRAAQAAELARGLGPGVRPVLFSATSGEGRDEVWDIIREVCAEPADFDAEDEI